VTSDFGFGDLNKVAVDLTAAAAGADKMASAAVRKTAFDVEATAKQFVPVDTAATKGSIFASDPGGNPLHDGSLVAEIGPTTEYSPYLEFGTSRMAPHAFMGPALDRHAPNFVEALKQAAQGPILRD
jgi:HK97 gp10 family phage protein